MNLLRQEWRLFAVFGGTGHEADGGMEGALTVSGGCDAQVYLFDHLFALGFQKQATDGTDFTDPEGYVRHLVYLW